MIYNQRLFKQTNFQLPGILILFFAVHATTNIIWGMHDNAFASFPHYYNYAGIALLKHYQNHNFAMLLQQSTPSVMHHLFAFTTWVFGLSRQTFVLPSTFCLGVLMVSIWQLCRKHFAMTNNAAQLAAVILSLYPAVFGYSRCYNFTIGLLAFTALNTLCAFNVYKKADIKYLLLWVFTLIAGLNLEPHHTHTEAAIFLLGISAPVLWLIYEWIFKTTANTKKQTTLNIALPLCGIIVALAILLPVKNGILAYLQYIFSESTRFEKISGHPGFIKYFVNVIMLPSEQIGVLWSVLLACGIIVSTKKSQNKGLLLLWLALPLVATACLTKKNSLYSIPVVIPAAIISAQALCLWKNKKTRRTLIGLVLATGITQLFVLSFADADHFSRRILFQPKQFAGKMRQTKVSYAVAPYQYNEAEQNFIEQVFATIEPRHKSPLEHLGVLTKKGHGQSNMHRVAMGVYLKLNRHDIVTPDFFARIIKRVPFMDSFRNRSRLYWLVEQDAYESLHTPQYQHLLPQLGEQTLCVYGKDETYRLFCPLNPHDKTKPADLQNG